MGIKVSDKVLTKVYEMPKYLLVKTENPFQLHKGANGNVNRLYFCIMHKVKKKYSGVIVSRLFYLCMLLCLKV